MSDRPEPGYYDEAELLVEIDRLSHEIRAGLDVGLPNHRAYARAAISAVQRSKNGDMAAPVAVDYGRTDYARRA